MKPDRVSLTAMTQNLLVAAQKAMLVFCLCASYLVAGSGAARDDDEPLVPEGPADKPVKAEQPPPATDGDTTPDAPRPPGRKVSAEESDRLERAIEGMRNAKDRVAGSDTGQRTQEIQNQVVKDLQELLAMMKKQQRNRQNQPPPENDGQPNADQSPDQRQKAQKGQGDPQNSGQRQEPHDGRRNQGKASDSQERVDPARAALAEESRRAQMIKDVWGHLPPHLRTAMQNTFSENYLPKYEGLVKKYYEALAEKNRKRPTR